MNSPLKDSAMLIALNISQWTARKHDRTATQEVDEAHGAKDAGRYNKLLISKAALDPMSKIEGAARDYHYSMTLPWGNNGERILPASLFLDYTQKMNGFKAQFNAAVQVFVAQYPELVQAARVRLGTLYNPKDYPDVSSIAAKFDFAMPVTPIPDAADFRVALNSEYVEAIKRDLTDRHARQQQEAVKHVWVRVREVVGKIHETCSKEKPRIFDSMIDNARQLIEVLPALNLTNDPDLARIAQEMQALVVSPDALRNSAVKRQSVAASADQILQSFPWR
jgi:hypothetical protein